MNEEMRSYALRLLSQRSYTTRGLREKLLTKKFSTDEIDAVLSRFTESGLLDDPKFALSFARARLTSSSASPRRVRQLLVQKGIAAAIADGAVAEVVMEEQLDISALLKRVAMRKLATLSGHDPHTVRRRLSGFLARRGYDLDDIRRTVTDLLR